MNASTPALALAFRELDKAMPNTLEGTKIEAIKETIRDFAITASIASALTGVLPGVGGVIAALTQTGMVWATYVKINKHLGISMKENTAKFIGSAIVTNLAANAGAAILALAGSCILSFIPILGNIAAMAINGAIGYIIIYAAAIIYLKVISKMVNPDGTIDISETDETKEAIKKVVEESDMDSIIKEGRSSYKEAKADGSIDNAKKNPSCPNCHAKITADQRFCSSCGTALK